MTTTSSLTCPGSTGGLGAALVLLVPVLLIPWLLVVAVPERTTPRGDGDALASQHAPGRLRRQGRSPASAGCRRSRRGCIVAACRGSRSSSPPPSWRAG